MKNIKIEIDGDITAHDVLHAAILDVIENVLWDMPLDEGRINVIVTDCEQERVRLNNAEGQR